MMEQIKLLTVDDNNIQAAGLARLFEECSSIDYLGNASTPEDCLERLENDPSIDVLLIDIQFPNSKMNGIDLANKIRSLYPFMKDGRKNNTVRIAFFSVSEIGFIDLDNGIHGLIPKGEDFQNIVSMVEMIHKFGATFSPRTTIDRSDKNIPDFWGMLTAREKMVFSLVIKGKSTPEIGEAINLSTHTVSTHRKNILRKIKTSGLSIDRIDDPRIVLLASQYDLTSAKSPPNSDG